MQRDDRPPASGRPSLLSAEQQAEADRQRLLSKLDDKASSTSSTMAPKRRSKLAWGAAGVGVVTLCAAAALWLAYEGQDGALRTPVLAEASQAGMPLPASAVLPAVPAVTPAATGFGAEPEVSTAAILEDVGVPAEKVANKESDKEKSLKEILQSPTPAAPAPRVVANPAPDELTRLLDKPAPPAPLPAAARKSPKRVVEADRPAVKLAAQIDREKASDKTKDKTRENAGQKPKEKSRESDGGKHRLVAAPSKKKELHPKASKASKHVDSDVALLAALVAHSKAYPEKIRPGSTAAKLKQCGKQSSANAGKCRERVCNGSGKDDLECKGVRLARATVGS